MEAVRIFLVGLGGGSVGCGDELVAVEQRVPSTRAPLTAALQALLSLKEREYGQSGLYNALYQSDLQLARVAIESGTATIELRGQLRLGGVCDAPRVEAQLRQTALQFPTVQRVHVTVNGTPLQQVLSED